LGDVTHGIHVWLLRSFRPSGVLTSIDNFPFPTGGEVKYGSRAIYPEFTNRRSLEFQESSEIADEYYFPEKV